MPTCGWPDRCNPSRRMFVRFALVCLTACTAAPPELEVDNFPAGVQSLSLVDTRTMYIASDGRPETSGLDVPMPYTMGTATPEVVSLPLAATDVAAGTRHACALVQRQVYCWGDHTEGALGPRGCEPPATEGAAPQCILNAAVLPNLTQLRAVVAGDDVTCATAYDDRVYCFGAPGSPALGGSVVPALDPPRAVRLPHGAELLATRVRMWHSTVCAIDRTATAWCWGEGFGAVPVQQPYAGVVDIALGTHHSCVLAADGVTCWGDNRNGQVGNLAAARSCGDGPCTLGPTRVLLDLPTSVVVGERHTCSLLASGDVACWGSNEFTQLGRLDAFLVGSVGIAMRGAIDVSASYARTCARRADGEAVCWGRHKASEEL